MQLSGGRVSHGGSGSQALRDKRDDFSWDVDRGFDVTCVREVTGDVYSTHVSFESFRIVGWHFRQFSWFGFYSELF